MKELSRTIPRDNHSYHLSMSEIFEHIADCHKNGYDAVITVAPDNEKTRTDQQRKALEVYCANIAKMLKSHGITMQAAIQTVFKKTEVIPTQSRVKECIIKPLVEALFDVKSTTKLKRHDLTELHANVSMIFAERLHIAAPEFPSVKAPPLSAYDDK